MAMRFIWISIGIARLLGASCWMRSPVICASKIDLGAERESVLGPPRTLGVVVEHGALEVHDVADVAGEVPIEAGRPCFCLAAGADGGETRGERVLVYLERVVARRNLKGAPAAV